jgi:hypothetical protein
MTKREALALLSAATIIDLLDIKGTREKEERLKIEYCSQYEMLGMVEDLDKWFEKSITRCHMEIVTEVA